MAGHHPKSSKAVSSSPLHETFILSWCFLVLVLPVRQCWDVPGAFLPSGNVLPHFLFPHVEICTALSKARMSTLCLVLSMQCQSGGWSCTPRTSELGPGWASILPPSLPSFSGGMRQKHICKGQKSLFSSQAPTQYLFASDSTGL